MRGVEPWFMRSEPSICSGGLHIVTKLNNVITGMASNWMSMHGSERFHPDSRSLLWYIDRINDVYCHLLSRTYIYRGLLARPQIQARRSLYIRGQYVFLCVMFDNINAWTDTYISESAHRPFLPSWPKWQSQTIKKRMAQVRGPRALGWARTLTSDII